MPERFTAGMFGIRIFGKALLRSMPGGGCMRRLCHQKSYQMTHAEDAISKPKTGCNKCHWIDVTHSGDIGANTLLFTSETTPSTTLFTWFWASSTRPFTSSNCGDQSSLAFDLDTD